MEKNSKQTAFLFPGQGAQYVGMGKDFYQSFPVAARTFQEAEDLLGYSISKLVFDGPELDLIQTQNSQVAIFVVSIAILRTIQELYSEFVPDVCAGLSLGEYTALAASGRALFSETLPIVQRRGSYMSEACDARQGTMAVILGLGAETVEKMVSESGMPDDLWTANFNCPGQVVISGTRRGVEEGSRLAKELGAKRVMPLQVHGAFHSGLMADAESKLRPHIMSLPIKDKSLSKIVMNVPGNYVSSIDMIRENLVKQVTQPVRWEHGIRKIDGSGLFNYVEVGCGKTLAGMNKRIGTAGRTISVDKVVDLQSIEHLIEDVNGANIGG